MRLHDELKSKLWKICQFNETPEYTWIDAVTMWIKKAEMQKIKTIKDIIIRLKWLDPYLAHKKLNEITKEYIEQIISAKEKENVSNATINHYLKTIRQILRMAHFELEWLDKMPLIKMRKADIKRLRWLTHEEAAKLLAQLPNHLTDMAAFTLCTGLRESNVCHLKWNDILWQQQHLILHADEAKNKKTIPIPLNQDAMAILIRWRSVHPVCVFAYKHKPIARCNTKAWRKALNRAGIENFRWHDLRHTWASWHVQNGTSLHELQQLGGWSSYEMVLRYAHLSSDHLRDAAERITGSNLVQGKLWVVK